jgi:hypothetical protein
LSQIQPNPAKSSQIQPNPAKPGQSQSKERLGFSLSESSLIKDLRGPPRAFFLLPARFARNAQRASNRRFGREPSFFHVCLVSLRHSAELPFLGGIMAQFRRICKKNGEKSPKRAELLRFETRSLVGMTGAGAAHRQIERGEASAQANGPRPSSADRSEAASASRR